MPCATVVNRLAADHRTTVHDQLGAVGEGVFDGVGVEVLVDAIQAIMAAAQSHGADRPGVLHPTAVVDDVDVEVAEGAAAGPDEGVELTKLKLHFAHFRRLPFVVAHDRTVHAVAAHQHDVADLAVVDALGHLLEPAGVMGIQSHAHLELLLFRLLGELQHAAGGRAVGRQRLLHEDVQPLLDRVAKMHPAKCQRSGKDRHVARLETIHRLLVGVEADELAIVGHVDLRSPTGLVLFLIAA